MYNNFILSKSKYFTHELQLGAVENSVRVTIFNPGNVPRGYRAFLERLKARNRRAPKRRLFANSRQRENKSRFVRFR